MVVIPIDPKYLESLVMRIKGVTGCAIKMDDAGNLTDIHVTAASDKEERLIARDVQTLLTVKAGVKVDHKKIMVVKVEAPEESSDGFSLRGAGRGGTGPAPARDRPREVIVERIEAERPAAGRLRFGRMAVSHEDGQVKAEITLHRGERRETGEAACADTRDGHLSAVVRATLEAVLLLYDPRMRFADPRFEMLAFEGEEVLVVYLSAVQERSVLSFAGAAVIRQDPRQAAVLATLAALNRRSGLWPPREGVDFDIL